MTKFRHSRLFNKFLIDCCQCILSAPKKITSFINFRAVVAHIISFSIIFSQTAWAFNNIVPPQNITDNPVTSVVIDTDRAGNAFVDRAQNGTPVVNINAASAGGVSANYYRDFNVNSENLILNNYQGEAAVSVLGGALHGNPNLNVENTKAADVILNEVTSSRVSNINGYTEVFGKQAELIIANPNGIIVSGAGFINTSRLSLVTGSSGELDSNGNLQPFLLSENPDAIISVVGRDVYDSDGNPVAYNLGIDMSSGNYVDLLSRIVQINGKILAGKEINIKTGNSQAVKNSSGWEVSSTDKADKPEFSIDSTAFGGIYAGRINIIATEDGVGVRTRGDVVANVDDINYDSSGYIETSGEILSARNTNIKTSKDISISNEIISGNDIDLTANKITNSNEIKSKNRINITTDDLLNENGKIISVNDLSLNLGLNNWVASGVLQSGGTLWLNAGSLTNAVADISGYNLNFNLAGDFINGTELFENSLYAENNLTLNIDGDVINFGKIVGDNDVLITNSGSVINGISAGSNATIHAGNNLTVSSDTRILNYGYIQALGSLSLESKQIINSDYELNANAQNLPTEEDVSLSGEYQDLYNNLSTITDVDVLYNLLDNIKTSDQYYAVQNRIRVVRINDLLKVYIDSASNNNVADILSLPEPELQESLQSFLGDNYIESDWVIDLTSQTADINQQISEQTDRTNSYNNNQEILSLAQYNEDKEAARQEYILLNGDDTGFTYPDFSFTPLTRYEYTQTVGETYLDYDQMINAAQLVAQTDRANRITQVFNEKIDLAQSYQSLDWVNMSDDDFNTNMSDLLGSDYDPSDWLIQRYSNTGSELTDVYLNSLRINNIDLTKTQKTGIHNYGRIYSGGNLSITSASVLHNNSGALIFSGGDGNFYIKNVLFNNSNAAGQGIFVNGKLNISGLYDSAAGQYNSLNQLVNYNGVIESNGDLNIKSTELINYGEDGIDFSGIDNNIYKAYKYYYIYKFPFLNTYITQTKEITETQYNNYIASGQAANVTKKYQGYYYVKEPPELLAAYTSAKVHLASPVAGQDIVTDKTIATITVQSDSSGLRSKSGTLSIKSDNVTNYNSKIYGLNINVDVNNLLNKTLSLNINATEYHSYKYKECKRIFGACVDKYWAYKNSTAKVVDNYIGNSISNITAQNELNIKGNKIGNGTYAVENDTGSDFLPSQPMNVPESGLQEIVRTGSIDPLADFKQPNGKYGIIRQGDILNGQYVYETDPTLIDLNHYLGSQYFMNRIGVDPHDVETKFIGDAFVEHEMIKNSLEQIQVFQNSYHTDEELDDYINNLYNALTADKISNLGLEFGHELTASQIAKLDTDIVWYVKKDVVLANGEKIQVLVPQVYLAKTTLDELYSAALAREDVKTTIRGDNVSISALSNEATSILTNIGAIVGNRQLIITTDEINNAAASMGQVPVLRGGDLLVLDTGVNGSVNNRSGTIETTNSDSNLVIKTGELNNTTFAQRENTIGDGYKKIETKFASTATIKSAGNMAVETSGDVNMAAGKISADGDMAVSVGGNLNSVSVQDYEYEYRKIEQHGTLSKSTTTDVKESIKNVGSEISSGGNMNLDVSGDATFAGTSIKAGENATLTVGGDTNILAVTDYNYKKHTEDKSSWGGLVKEKSVNETSAQNLRGANLDVSNGLSITTGNNLNLIASNVNVGSNADINAGNDINVFSADQIATEYSMHQKTNYLSDALKTVGTFALAGATAGASLLVVNDGIDVNCSGGKCGASMEIGSQKKDENFKKTTTSIGSSITVGGDLTAHGENDVNILGSDLSVGGNGSISANNDINVLESQNNTTESSSHSDTKITAGVHVGNSYVDAANAAKNLVEAGDAVTKATESLKHMQDLQAQGRASAEAVKDAEFNLTMATLNLANAELAMASSVAGAASAAGTALGTGMYASGSLNFETNKSSMDSTSTQSVASNLFGNNLTFTSGSDITQIGSNVGATDMVSYDVGHDLFVGSGTDTYKTTSSAETITAGGSIGNNAVQVNAGFNKSQNTASGTTNVNSNISAQNIIVKTGNDAEFSGANVNAGENLTMDIGHDLTVESKQDTDYANGSNRGVNVGAGGGNGNSSGSGGFNVDNSNHDSAWVNDVTELTGGKVDITVGNKTTLTGGMIAGLDENGNDNGNLTLSTGELEYSDLHDFNTSHNGGFGFSTSVGGNTDAGIASAKPDGSTTISMTDTGSETKQTTHSTIGGGSITVAENSDTSGLNRDVSMAQEMTKDLVTGALDSSVTIDNRILSESGRAQIATQQENLADNVEQVGKGLRNNIVVKSIENYATDDTKSLSDTVNDYVQQDREMTELQQKHKELVAALNGLTNYESPEAQKVLQQVADFVGENGGFTGDLKLASVDGNVAGFSYKSNDGSVKNITINLANVDMTDPNALMKVIYHETTNFDQHDKNERTAINRGETGSAIFDLKNYGNANTNSMDNGQWLSNYGNSDTVKSGSLSLINGVNNTNGGNGKSAAFGEIAIPLAGAGCVGTTVACPIGATAGAIAGLVMEAGIYIGVIGGTTYLLNEKVKDLKEDSKQLNSNLNNSNKSSNQNEQNNKENQTELKYEAASYHHQNSSGLKSKAPSNPQETLNNSTQIKDNSLRRIGVDSKTGEINIFDSTNDGTYHGHTRTWKGLTDAMKNSLIKAGKATKKGVIVP